MQVFKHPKTAGDSLEKENRPLPWIEIAICDFELT